MDDKIELFYETLSFSPFWLLVDFLLIAHLFFSWYRSYKRTGWKIDVWHWTLLLMFFVYVLLMYPFNASILNVFAAGQDYFALEKYVDKAFAITLMGYLSVWLGRALYDNSQKRNRLFLLVQPFERILEKNVSSQKSVQLLSVGTLLLFIALFLLQIKNGALFNPRTFFLQEERLRPLYNLALTLFNVVLIFLSLRCIQFKERLSRSLLLLFLFLSIFMGIRSLCIFGILTFVFYYALSRKGQISFFKVGILALGLIFLGIMIESLRNASWAAFSSVSSFAMNVFYGNHFSDTRDFAWMLAYWDGEYLYGKTYLAGFLSFLPRFFSEYRQEWSWGVYVGKQIGFDPAVHPGLRPGLFGEVFFNFGYVGVLLLGTTVGYALRYADQKMREAVEQKENLIRGYAGSFAYIFAFSFFMTAGFWSLYLFILINLLLYAFYKIRFRAGSAKHG